MQTELPDHGKRKVVSDWGSSSLSGCGIRRERWDTLSASVPSAPERATAESPANDCEASGKSET